MSETVVESSLTLSVNDGDSKEAPSNVSANGHAADLQSTKKKPAVPESNSETVDTGKNPKKAVKEKNTDESKSPVKRKAKDEDGDVDKEASPAKKKSKPSSKDEAEVKSHIEKQSSNSEVKSSVDQEDDDEEEEQEVKPGLLEMPIVLEEGVKREKKKVQRLDLTPSADKSDASKKIEIADGAGTRLGEMPRVELHLQKSHADDLKPLHRLLFDKPGPATLIKKNIRRFSGFPFSETSHELQKKKDKLEKYTNAMLKFICEVLDIERGGKKEDIVERILNFLMKPEASGKALPAGKKRRSSIDKSKKKSGNKKRKSDASKPKKKQAKKSEDTDEGDESEDEKEEQKSSSEVESNPESASENDSEKKKPSKKATPAKKSKKVENKTPKSAEKSSAKKPAKKQSETTKKKATPKKSKKLQDSSDDSGDDDNEPLAKKSGPPTDSVLRDVIKKILKTANLEEVTMKTVCKQVYDKYPEYDLTSRKDFIKTTVKQILK